MKSVICVTFAILVARCNGLQTFPSPMCTTDPSATVGPNDPRLPQVLSPSFQVHIEATISDRKESVTADEYVDISAGMSSMVIKQNGQIESLILNYNTNETYHIMNQQCTVLNQALDPNDVLIGGSTGNSKMPHTYSTGTVLRFAQKYGEVYKGQSTIRGITTDHWQSCMFWPFLSVSFTLDYYFTVKNWTTADGSPQIPVRAEVIGYNNLLGSGTGSDFHHVYDYVGFTTFVQDPTVFQTPRGIPCAGRKKTRAMPTLQPQYQFREEITSVMGSSVTQVDIWYDFNYHLVRFDYRPAAIAYPYYSLDAVTEIHDFNTGVAYVIDKTFRNCSIVPIENSTWDATRNVSQVPLHLKKPEELFYLDSSYAYSGQKTVRGINCDVFSTIKTNYSDGGLMGMNVSFEVYFMSTNWTSSNDIVTDTSSSDTPVRLEISEPITGYDVVYDFFDFDQEHPDIRHAFDITPCFTDSQQIDFQMTFPGDAQDFLLQYKVLLLDLAVVYVAKAGSLSPIRIQKTSIHWDEGNTYFLGTLLEKPPALAKFRRWPNLVAEYPDDLMLHGVIDAFTCASSCDLQTQATCKSFDICPTAQTCAESLQYTSDGSALKSNLNCDHFSRVLSGPVDHEMAVNDAYKIIKDVVYTGNMVIPVILPASVSLNVTFKASEITDKVWGRQLSNKAKYTSYLTVLHRFKLSANKEADSLYSDGIETSSLQDVSVEDCAYICLQELVFTCNSFNYQAITSTCVVNSLFPDTNQTLVKTKLGTDLYTRDYTVQYSEVPGQYLSDSRSHSLTLLNIGTPNYCAKLCTNNSTLPCKSFNYSPKSHTCILNSMMFYAASSSDVTPSGDWNHYKMNYTSGFRVFPNREIQQKEQKSFKDTSPELCARYCVDQSAFYCDSYSMCRHGDTGTCRLYTQSLYDVHYTTTVPSNNCTIFNREYYPDGRRYIPHYKEFPSSTSSATFTITTAPTTATTTTTTSPVSASVTPAATTRSPKTATPYTTTQKRPGTTISITSPTKSSSRTNPLVITVSTSSSPTKLTSHSKAPTKSVPHSKPLPKPSSISSSPTKPTFHSKAPPQSVPHSKPPPKPSQCSPVTVKPSSCGCKGQTASSSALPSNDGHTSSSLQHSSPDSVSPYPTGTVVGVAIGMLAVGILIGVGASFLIKKRQLAGPSSITNPVYSP